MKTLKLAVTVVAVGFVGMQVVAADPRGDEDVPVRDRKASSYHEPLAPAVAGKETEGKLIFVTGSRIPQRVTVKAIGTNTVSPVRVYTREEIDRMGKFTTSGILAQDPSVRIVGNGSH